MIVLENMHLNYENKKDELNHFLLNNGYNVTEFGGDTLALR